MRIKMMNSRLSILILGISLSVAGLLSSCSKTSSPAAPTGPTAPTNPGGYDSANQIAGLAGFWSFNNTLFDSAAGITGVSSGTTFTAGPLPGTSALQGSANDGFVLYTNGIGAQIPAMTSFSVAFWLNSAQITNGAQAIFQLMFDSAAAGGWPYLDVDAEGYSATSDSLNIKMYFFNDANNWAGQSFQVYLDTAVSKWTFVAFTYNAATSGITAYENGVSAGLFNYPYGPSQSPPTTTQGPLTVYGNDPGAATGNPNAAPLWGAPNFAATTGIIFDNWQTSTTPNSAPNAANGALGGWAVPYQGALYHFRIYNTALAATDVNSLYILEAAGF
jgi:hypothetical protein